MNKIIELLTADSYFLLLSMVVLHIIADYILQTDVMATYKQKKSWEGLNKQYEVDYMVFLVVHACLWSAVTFIPILLIANYNTKIYYNVVFINTIIYAIIDDLKCNRYKINLIIDQILHLIQIEITIAIVDAIMKR